MRRTKHIFIIGELYKPLIPWFLEDQEPKGVPAVYNLYQYLGNSSEYQFYSIVFNRSINRKKVFPNGSVIELKKFNVPNYYLWKLLVFFRLLFFGNRKMKQEHFDLVYGLSTFSTIAAILGKWRRVTSVGRIYGTILTKDVRQRNYFRLYTRFFFDVLAIKVAADHVICTLDGTEYDKVFHFFNKKRKVQLFYNGMDVALRNRLLQFENSKKLDVPLRFCYIARLEYYKRQDIAIKIVHHLVNQYQIDCQLTILGSGSKAADLHALVRQYSLESQVHFIEEMAHKAIPDFLAKQQAAMFFYEGGSLGNILWESALAGKLIITVDNAGTGAIFKDGKNCLIAPESEDFAEVMAEKIKAYLHQAIDPLTQNSRAMVESLITDWPSRFDKEFDYLFKKQQTKSEH